MTDLLQGEKKKPFGVPPAFLYGSFLLPLHPLIFFQTFQLYLTFSSVKFIENYWKDDKNQSIFSTEPFT